MAFLLVVSGPNEGDFHPLARQSLTIGRNDTCTIQLLDEEVSREHLNVRFNEAGNDYHASDNVSANGSFLNGLRITEEKLLGNGDVIQVGGSELIFSEQDFIDRDTAIEHYGRRKDEDGRQTVAR